MWRKFLGGCVRYMIAFQLCAFKRFLCKVRSGNKYVCMRDRAHMRNNQVVGQKRMRGGRPYRRVLRYACWVVVERTYKMFEAGGAPSLVVRDLDCAYCPCVHVKKYQSHGFICEKASVTNQGIHVGFRVRNKTFSMLFDL